MHVILATTSGKMCEKKPKRSSKVVNFRTNSYGRYENHAGRPLSKRLLLVLISGQWSRYRTLYASRSSESRASDAGRHWRLETALLMKSDAMSEASSMAPTC